MKFPIAVAANNKNDKIRQISSSGAVFYELAGYVIKNHGIVCGARYDENWNVVHGYADTMERVMAFIGSKYVQSSVGNLFKKVKEFLDEKRLVLFSGTPCQIEGLKMFLQKDYENLITVDLVCHGVPSPKVWQEYIDLRSDGRPVTSVNFRDKTEGWVRFSLRMKLEGGKEYRKNQFEDLYMKGFLQDIYLRPSCYNCYFKGIQRKSDITLADLWKCQSIAPDLFDDKGTSLILIQSQNGMEIWNDIKKNFVYKKLTLDDAKLSNPNMTESVSKNVKREKYYSGNKSFEELEKITYVRKPSFVRRIFRKMKKSAKYLK